MDFTGYACVNCRKMEEKVWADPKVLKLLNESVVLISLYVDDKRELPIDEQYVSRATGKQIKTIGQKWSDFQISNYKANAQPLYVLLDLNEKIIHQPIAYTPEISTYYNWLLKGIQDFK